MREDHVMPIPKEILAVDRPKNTVVTAYGKDKFFLLYVSAWAAETLTDVTCR